jgi:AcrR family transcriptional regulator
MVDAILEGAVRAFSAAATGSPYDASVEKGSPSVNRIAEIAGVSIGSLYQYFPGKEAIVAALVRKRTRDIHDRLLAVVRGSTDLTLEEGAARLVDCILEMKLANERADETIFREALRHALTREAFALDAELVGAFAAALEAWRPKLREDVPAELAAHLLFHGLRGVMVVGAFSRPDLTADPRLRHEMVHLVVAYLRRD